MGDETVLRELHQVALGARDLATSIRFYRDEMGLMLLAEFDPPGLAFFDLGSCRLLLERSESPRPGTGVVYFRVDDIHASYRALLDRGVLFDSEPHLIYRDDQGTFGPAGSEEWMAFLRDPDENALAIAATIPGG